MRVRRKASPPGSPPSVHNRPGLKEIAFFVENDRRAYIGPRKFRRRSKLNKPVPHVHEKGGTAIEVRNGRWIIKRYPERSFMYRAVKTLKRKGKLNSQFRYMLRG